MGVIKFQNIQHICNFCKLFETLMGIVMNWNKRNSLQLARKLHDLNFNNGL